MRKNNNIYMPSIYCYIVGFSSIVIGARWDFKYAVIGGIVVMAIGAMIDKES